MSELLEEILDDPLIALAKNVVKGGEATCLASFFPVIRLLGLGF
jgi:hypothetical protein